MREAEAREVSSPGCLFRKVFIQDSCLSLVLKSKYTLVRQGQGQSQEELVRGESQMTGWTKTQQPEN